eukprot:gene3692-13760_t
MAVPQQAPPTSSLPGPARGDPKNQSSGQEEVEKRTSRAERFQISESVLDYKPAEDEEAKKRRAAKFGTIYQPTEAALMDMDLFEDRREVPLEIVRREEAIHIYGVDVMSTSEVLRYFTDYGPTYVEWLDDSSCNVLFKDIYSVKRAIAARGTPFPPEDSAATSGMDPTDPDNMRYFWHKGEDFIKDGTPVKLVYRMATVDDVRDLTKPKLTRELWKANHVSMQSNKSRKTDNTSARGGDTMVVDGEKQRGERGGKKARRRKARMQDGQVQVFQDDGGDVDMEDAEDGLVQVSQDDGRDVDMEDAEMCLVWACKGLVGLVKGMQDGEVQMFQYDGRDVGMKEAEGMSGHGNIPDDPCDVPSGIKNP